MGSPLPGQVVHQLIKLHREGNKIVILGHSLGGGVAALLGVLLKDVRVLDYVVVRFDACCTGTALHMRVSQRLCPLSLRPC